MLRQFMFTCTSKAIKYKPLGLRWVCGPSHLGLTSWKHLASSCHNSIQIHFGLTQAPPLLVEVIPDYRATVVKCWYNVFFLFFFHSLCLYSCSSNSRTSCCAALVWFTLCKIDVSFQTHIHEIHTQLGSKGEMELKWWVCVVQLSKLFFSLLALPLPSAKSQQTVPQ